MKIRWCIVLAILALVSVSYFEGVSGKSLYIIGNINANPTPISAFDIQPAPNYLVYQSVNMVPRRGDGGVGLAIDSDSGILFVTYEESNTVELVNGTSMLSIGSSQAPDTENLAGIVYDGTGREVYTVDRETDNLYTYSWDVKNQNLSLISTIDLKGVELAHGLALDRSRALLYVGDMTGVGLSEGPRDGIKVFSTDDWSSVANYSVNQTVQAIAVDSRSGFVYTGKSCPNYGSKGLLIKYELDTGRESSVDIRQLTGYPEDNVVGIAVDEDTGLVYIATGNQGGGGSGDLMVLDSNLNLLHGTNLAGSPTGIVVPSSDISYNPLAFAVTSSREKASPGNRITYQISSDNSENQQTLTNVITEDVLPSGLEFVYANGNASYDESSRRAIWVIGTVDSGSNRTTLELVARVSKTVSKGERIDNTVIIRSDQTPPTTQHSYVNVTGFFLGLGGMSGPIVDVLTVVGILVASYIIGWGAASAVTKLWLIPRRAEASTQLLVSRAVTWGIAIVGGLTAISQLDVNTAPLLVGTGVGGVALAFGSKEIMTNLVSGVILTIDRPLRRGDMVEVQGAKGEVLEVGLRATIIRTRDNVSMLIPNANVVMNRITNYSKYDPKIRLQIPVHVPYGSDLEEVRQVLLEVSSKHEEVLEDPEREVRIVEFGDSSINLVVFAWIPHPGRRLKIKHEINLEIASEFSKRGIKMPFNQRDIWMRE